MRIKSIFGVKRKLFNDLTAFKLKLTVPLGAIDCDLDGIHFKNGRFNLATQCFEERTYDENSLITQFINYNWEPSSTDDLSEIHCNIFCKLIREPELFPSLSFQQI